VEILEDRDLLASVIGGRPENWTYWCVWRMIPRSISRFNSQISITWNGGAWIIGRGTITKGIGAGQNYSLLPPVIGINILD
jgi:hypothetical protein